MLLPDGGELPVWAIEFGHDNEVEQIMTAPVDDDGQYWQVWRGAELDQCRLIAKANGFYGNVEYWSEPA